MRSDTIGGSHTTVKSQYPIVDHKSRVEGHQVIRSLEIDNFRCFKTLRLDDVRRFNILTGSNGSGKTALLESVFIAGGGSAEIFLRTNAWRGRDLIRVSPASILPLFEDFFHQFHSRAGLRIRFLDSSGDERQVEIVVKPSGEITLPFDSTASESSPARDVTFTWKTPNGTIVSKVEVDKDGVPRLSQPEDVLVMVFLNQSTIGGSKENAERFSALSEKNAEKPIRDAVSRIFPQVTGLDVLSPSGIPGIYASVRGVNKKMPIGLVSSGVNKFVAILVGIAWAKRGAVLIDEIENGLYHKQFAEIWKEIAECAQDNHTQIFATTHSREFLEAVAPSVESDNKNYSLLHLEKLNGEAKVTSFKGKQFAGAVESGFEVR
jgi:hypothetical protein